jgi:hypothetical protein
MNYYNIPSKKSSALGFLIALIGIVLTVIVAIYFDRKQNKRAKEAEKESIQQTILILEDLEKNLNREIINHYEKIDSLIVLRDSVNYDHSTKTVIQLQQSIDSIFNRQSYLPDKAGSYPSIAE